MRFSMTSSTIVEMLQYNLLQPLRSLTESPSMAEETWSEHRRIHPQGPET